MFGVAGAVSERVGAGEEGPEGASVVTGVPAKEAGMGSDEESGAEFPAELTTEFARRAAGAAGSSHTQRWASRDHDTTSRLTEPTRSHTAKSAQRASLLPLN